MTSTVSSSLKRESNFLTEIQKLRLENEKLRKQAQNSSQHLKKQVAKDEAEAKEDEEDEQTVVEVVKTKSNKRKADSQQQLSPPPTPEALRTTSTTTNTTATSSAPAAAAPEPPKKKRMVKQTKSLQSQVHVIKRERTVSSSNGVPISTPVITSSSSTNATTTNTSPWSPLLDETIALNTYPTSSPPNYYHMQQTSNNINYTNATSTVTATTTTPSPIHNDLLFLTPTPIDMYTNMQHTHQQPFHTMINPMLLSPYFVPSNDNNTADVSYNHQRDNFYLS